MPQSGKVRCIFSDENNQDFRQGILYQDFRQGILFEQWYLSVKLRRYSR